MKNHSKFVNNPQRREPPDQADYVTLVQAFDNHNGSPCDKETFDIRNYRNCKLVPYGTDCLFMYPSDKYYTFTQHGELNIQEEDDVGRSYTDFDKPWFVVRFDKAKYTERREQWRKYWNWKDARNPTRGELEDKFGYDTKHALHLVRLLRTGYEAITEGKYLVNRPDAEELLAIRNGDWTYEELLEYADDIDAKTKAAMNKSALPQSIDRKLIAQLVLDIQDCVWDNAR